MGKKTRRKDPITNARLRLLAEVKSTRKLSPERREEIYKRLLELKLSPEDIEEFIPEVVPASRARQSA